MRAKPFDAIGVVFGEKSVNLFGRRHAAGINST
jgi:hypothetical protein